MWCACGRRRELPQRVHADTHATLRAQAVSAAVIHALCVWWQPFGAVADAREHGIGFFEFDREGLPAGPSALLWAAPAWATPWLVALSQAALLCCPLCTFCFGHLSFYGVAQGLGRGGPDTDVSAARRGGEAVAASKEGASLLHSFPYSWVRHPMMTCILAGVWLHPLWTAPRLLFAVGLTVYVVVGTLFEEAALTREFGDAYLDYSARVPMFCPRPRASKRKSS